MIKGTLGASSLANLLAGKAGIRADEVKIKTTQDV